jgi:hypothetical protein
MLRFRIPVFHSDARLLEVELASRAASRRFYLGLLIRNRLG